MSDRAIEVRDLEFRYRKGSFSFRVTVFGVEMSETVAVIGPSGTGKTTLLNLLAGCCPPDTGSVRIQGADIVQMPDRTRRDFRIRRIGMIFQEFELLDHLNVLDNILLPYRITPSLNLDPSVRERAGRLAGDVGIGDKLKRNVRRLSQGERQRVALCRALVTEPAVLLCDEPTGNLDPENSRRVMDILFRYVEDHGGTLIAVTHDHDLARRFSRTVDILNLSGGPGG